MTKADWAAYALQLQETLERTRAELAEVKSDVAKPSGESYGQPGPTQ